MEKQTNVRKNYLIIYLYLALEFYQTKQNNKINILTKKLFWVLYQINLKKYIVFYNFNKKENAHIPTLLAHRHYIIC